MDRNYNGMEEKTKTNPQTPLLEVKSFSLSFPQYLNGLQKQTLQVITDFSLQIHKGEIVAVVGASGSGKSLLADAILGILPKSASPFGEIYYKGNLLSTVRQKELRGKEIMLIPQSIKALDPLMKVGNQVQTVISDKKNKKRMQQEAFRKLGLNDEVANAYPFELSGGMARRVLIATAMVCEAELIIADEPTPGLDKQVRDETLGYIKELVSTGEKGVMFITHDIDAATRIADKIAVFNDGVTLEVTDAKNFSGKGEFLKHPYSKALWNALPENGFEAVFKEKLKI